MNCVKCQTPLEQGARFCGACGTQQPGAVIPQAAVRSNAKTIFQGSAPMPVAPPKPAAGAPPAPGQAAPSSPMDKPGPVVSKDLGFAATIAPGTGNMPVITPPQKPIVPAPAAALKPAPAPAPAPKPAPVAAPPGDDVDVDLTGKTLNNRYVVEQRIGEGGFGAVYRARQTQMNRLVALKVLHARMAKDQQVVGRFKREAQASSLLRAPHTVQVYDFDQTPEGVMYLAMEMLQGKSLHAALRDGPLDPLRAAKVLDGIADSLGEAHGQGIVHRDIKPENVFLEPRPAPDFVKVLDFGIAKIVSGDGLGGGPALTAVGQTLGTLEYMSPEQLMGATLDGRSDLYALGILGYEMLTGNLPFPGKTPGEIITAHLKTTPKPPSQAAPQRKIPALMDQILLKCMEKQKDKRYKDAQELRDDLQRVIGELSTVGSSAATVAAPVPAAVTEAVASAARSNPPPMAAPPAAASGARQPSVPINVAAVGAQAQRAGGTEKVSLPAKTTVTNVQKRGLPPAVLIAIVVVTLIIAAVGVMFALKH